MANTAVITREQDRFVFEPSEAYKQAEERMWQVIDNFKLAMLDIELRRQKAKQRMQEAEAEAEAEAEELRQIAASKRKFAEVISTKFAAANSIVKPAARKATGAVRTAASLIANSRVFQWCKGAAASAFSFIGRQVAKISWRDVGSRVMSILTSQLGREIAKKLFGEVGGNLLRRLQQFIGGTSDRLFNRLFGGLTN